MIEGLSAVTFAVSDLERSLRFYESLGFELQDRFEGFATFRIAGSYLNLEHKPGFEGGGGWGRVIFYVSDVDAVYALALSLGLTPSFAPRDAAWNERYFHLSDPDGHELSFARPI